MLTNITRTDLFCDYYSIWIAMYKEGAIRDVTMEKYRLTQAWLKKLVPDMSLCLPAAFKRLC